MLRVFCGATLLGTILGPYQMSISLLWVGMQAAGDAAADAGQTVKDAATSDPLDAAKSAASDVTDAAKKAADKLPGQGIDTKPVFFSGRSLQVNVVDQVPSLFSALHFTF